MTFSGSASPSSSPAAAAGKRATFICNVCGEECPRTDGPPGRETLGCENCISTVRLRGLIALMSRELFGTNLALPDFPELKELRGFGMSDPKGLAKQLVKKFDYTNTFYHQPPTIDITNPPETELGRYDFIISSEVMEHIPPPAVEGFRNLHRLLKPDGLLLLTVPYRIDCDPEEHFPNLHEYSLTKVGGKTVLVNRTREGKLETFENLCFHGGDGSTLEMRIYTEESLLQIIREAGFDEVRIAADEVPEFGVEHAETWSLPVVARKGKFRAPAEKIARAYGVAAKDAGHYRKQLKDLQGDYERHIEFHRTSQLDMERQLAERLDWVKKAETELAERTAWSQSLENEKNEAVRDFGTAQAEVETARARIEELLGEIQRLRAEQEALENRKWIKLGRALGRL